MRLRRIDVPTDTAILGTCLALSGAANLGATLGDPAWMVAGLAATAAVPMALHLWPRIAGARGVQAAVRLLAIAVIVSTAAAVTVAHTVDLLGAHWLSFAIVASVELLGVLAAMARAARTVHTAEPSEPRTVHAVHTLERTEYTQVGERAHAVHTVEPSVHTPVQPSVQTEPSEHTMHSAPMDRAHAAQLDRAAEQTVHTLGALEAVQRAYAAHTRAHGEPPTQAQVVAATGLSRGQVQRKWSAVRAEYTEVTA